jgi:hypothetical protein
MALTSLEATTGARRTFLANAFAHLKARLPAAENLLLQRLAGTVFLIRVINAVLAFGVQILLARLIGRSNSASTFMSGPGCWCLARPSISGLAPRPSALFQNIASAAPRHFCAVLYLVAAG